MLFPRSLDFRQTRLKKVTMEKLEWLGLQFALFLKYPHKKHEGPQIKVPGMKLNFEEK